MQSLIKTYFTPVLIFYAYGEIPVTQGKRGSNIPTPTYSTWFDMATIYWHNFLFKTKYFFACTAAGLKLRL